MKKKQIKHFVPEKNERGDGVPACNGFADKDIGSLIIFSGWGEIAKTRRDVTCGNCRRTRVFRKLK